VDYLYVFASVTSRSPIQILPKITLSKVIILQKHVRCWLQHIHKVKKQNVLIANVNQDSAHVQDFLKKAYGLSDTPQVSVAGISSSTLGSPLLNSVKKDLLMQRHQKIREQSRPISIDEFSCATSIFSTPKATPDKVKIDLLTCALHLDASPEYVRWRKMWSDSIIRSCGGDLTVDVRDRLTKYRKDSRTYHEQSKISTSGKLKRVSSRGEEITPEPSFVGSFSAKQVGGKIYRCVVHIFGSLPVLDHVSNLNRHEKLILQSKTEPRSFIDTSYNGLALSPGTYEVNVDDPDRRGLGLKLELLHSNKLFVTKFNPLTDGSIGPVEATGFVCIGDQLIIINGIDLRDKQPEEVAVIVSTAVQTASQFTLIFAYGCNSSILSKSFDMTFSGMLMFKYKSFLF
jgi:hypothetical protein